MSDNRSFFSELKRRKVYQTAVAYVAFALALWGAVEIASGAFAWSGRVLQTVIVVSVVGLPIALLAAWVFEIRLETEPPTGTVRRSKALAVGLSAGIIAFLVLGTTLANVIDPEELGGALLVETDGAYRLAVLYFEDRTPEGTLGHVADALTEELIEELRRAGLDVVSETGVRPFRGGGVEPDSVARLLNVSGLVEGWLQQNGSRVSVATRLVDGRDGASLVNATYETSVSEITELRDRVVAGVGSLVRLGIGRNVRLQAQRSAAPSTDTWLGVAMADAWMKQAQDAVLSGDAEGLAESLDAAEAELVGVQALAPNWSEPVTRQAWVAYERYPLASTGEELASLMEEAAELASAALEVDPGDLDAYEARGTATYRRWLAQLDPDEVVRDSLLGSARRDLQHVLSVDSLDVTANSTYSHLLYQVDEWRGAAVAARRSYYADPYLVSDVRNEVLWRLYAISYDLNEYEDAALGCTEGRNWFPDDFRFVQCQILLMTMPDGDPDVDRAWELHAGLLPMLTEGVEYFNAQARMFVGGIIGRAAPDSARAVFEAARVGPGIDPDGELVAFEAAMRSVMGDVEGSIALLKQHVAANPDNPPGQHWWWRNVEGRPDFERLRAEN